MRRYVTLLMVLTGLLALTVPAFAQTVLFGPKTYTRTVGPPNQFTDTFFMDAATTEIYTHIDAEHVRSLHRLHHPRA